MYVRAPLQEGSHAWYYKPDQNPTAREVIGHSGKSTTVLKVAAELPSKVHVNTHRSQLSALLTLGPEAGFCSGQGLVQRLKTSESTENYDG